MAEKATATVKVKVNPAKTKPKFSNNASNHVCVKTKLSIKKIRKK